MPPRHALPALHTVTLGAGTSVADAALLCGLRAPRLRHVTLWRYAPWRPVMPAGVAMPAVMALAMGRPRPAASGPGEGVHGRELVLTAQLQVEELECLRAAVAAAGRGAWVRVEATGR
jgi:hypothetical protein